MIKIFKSAVIRQQLSQTELNALVTDFKNYKSKGIVPIHFGRDVPYDHPHTLPIVQTEQVQHIHLGSEDKPLPLKKVHFHRTSDTHLVYCPAALTDECYLLMAILSPNGHQQAKSRDIMYKLGKMAELFRGKF